MNPFEMIKYHEKEFTKSDLKISNAIFSHPESFIQRSIVQCTSSIDTSPSAIIRFCKKIGYSGFSEFSYELSNFLSNQSASNENNFADTIKSYKNAIDNLILIPKEDIESLAKSIIEASRIRIFGAERTGLAAKNLAICLVKSGIAAESIESKDFANYIIETSIKDELHIYFSVSSGITWIDNITESINRKVKTALITHNSKVKIPNINHLIVLPSLQHLSLFTSQVLNFIFIEFLISEISRLNNNKRSTDKI